MGVQLTPGQRCLLDLLQRKLTSTIESYAKLARKKQQQSQSADTNNEVELELQRLKEKIRRISSRQKRFTLEIINGNGNNTIPKESFFEALGLITKETLVKLNSKTNERRRRTTANPRFSHEAIQAKKALEPLQRRTIESRVSRSGQDSSNRPSGNTNNNNNNSNNKLSQRSGSSSAGGGGSATGNRRGGNRVTRNRNTLVQKELLAAMQREINTKVNQIQKKRESNKELERRNEMIRRRGLEIISAINLLKPDQGLAIRQKQQRQQQIQCQLQQQQQQQLVFQKQQQQQRNVAKAVNGSLVESDLNSAANDSQQPDNNDNDNDQVNQVAQKPAKKYAALSKAPPGPPNPLFLEENARYGPWYDKGLIDLECEESLDGLD